MGAHAAWEFQGRGATKSPSPAFTMLIQSLPFMGLWLSMPLESELLGHRSIFYQVHRFAEGGDLSRVTK